MTSFIASWNGQALDTRAAADSDDRIVYDQATGSLFYDADGSGSGAALLFAVLDTSPTIAASDFAVV